MDQRHKQAHAARERQQEEAAYRAKMQRDLLSAHATETPEYWLELARNERAFAAEDRARRGGSVESVRLHEAKAAEYEATAQRLSAARALPPEEHEPDDDGPALQGALLRGQLADTATLRRYLEAGRAVFTIRSRTTGTRFTFKASRPSAQEHESRQVPGAVPRPRPIWIKVLTGSDNERSYSFVGTVWPEGDKYRYAHSPKSTIGLTAPSVLAVRWMIHALNADPALLLRQAEIWHEGRCGRCGRRLTVPESISSGFGPECAGIVGVDR